MNIGAVADQLAQVFGIPTYAQSPDLAKARILSDLNAAIQQLQDAGEDFYGRADQTVNLVDNQQSYQLPDNIQTVLDPVRLADGSLLTKITSRGAFNRFGPIFLDQLGLTVTKSIPTHYFVESKASIDFVLQDSARVFFYVAPAPDLAQLTAGTSVLLQVINEPGLFTAADLTAGTAVIPVPDKYVESIFLPIARYNAMGSFLFYDKDKVPHLEDDYIRALQLLDKADPRRPKPRDSRADALQIRQSRQEPQGQGANQ